MYGTTLSLIPPLFFSIIRHRGGCRWPGAGGAMTPLCLTTSAPSNEKKREKRFFILYCVLSLCVLFIIYFHRFCVKLTDSVSKLKDSQISQIRIFTTRSVRDSKIGEIFVLKKSLRKIGRNNSPFFSMWRNGQLSRNLQEGGSSLSGGCSLAVFLLSSRSEDFSTGILLLLIVLTTYDNHTRKTKNRDTLDRRMSEDIYAEPQHKL
jgi:hypothetical protein